MVKTRVYCLTDSCKRYANLSSDGYCPRCVSAGAEPLEEESSTCNICNDEIIDAVTKSIGCDGCGNWFHAKCAGPQALIDLITAADNQGIQGMLLWFCPDCASGPTRTFSVQDSKCVNVPPPRPKKTMQETSYGTICNDYLHNTCQFGISGKGKDGKECVNYHPKMCRAFIRFGPHGKRGCNKSNCEYFHPKLCSKSLKPISQRLCTNQSCGFFHLPRTKRHAPQHHHHRPQQRGGFDRGHQTNRIPPVENSDLQSSAAIMGQDPFLGNLVRNLVKETIQMELATLRNLAPSPAAQPAPPFLPGMSHFSQPWNPPMQPMSSQQSGPPLTQQHPQWTS